MKLTGRQSKNVIDARTQEGKARQDAEAAIASAAQDRIDRYRFDPLYKKTPMEKQTTNGGYTWYNNKTKEGFKRLTRPTGIPAGKLKK